MLRLCSHAPLLLWSLLLLPLLLLIVELLVRLGWSQPWLTNSVPMLGLLVVMAGPGPGSAGTDPMPGPGPGPEPRPVLWQLGNGLELITEADIAARDLGSIQGLSSRTEMLWEESGAAGANRVIQRAEARPSCGLRC